MGEGYPWIPQKIESPWILIISQYNFYFLLRPCLNFLNLKHTFLFKKHVMAIA